MKRKRGTYVFIDASNIIYGAKCYGWFIDHKKLIDYLSNKYRARKVFYYFGKDSRNQKQENFLRKLKQFGYVLRAKQVKWYGERRKANCDVDLTLDAIIYLKRYNRAIFLTGDGDFSPLFEYLRKKKKKDIIIISWPKITAQEIRKFAAEKFVDFNSLRYFLERHKKRGRL